MSRAVSADSMAAESAAEGEDEAQLGDTDLVVSPLASWMIDRLEPGLACDTAIHPGDAMLRFSEQLYHGSRQQAVLEYFRSGLAAFRVAEQILDWRFGAEGPAKIVDFGCGHGRVSRFLARRYGEERLVATEADPSGVGFVERFGVRAIRTPVDPAACDLAALVEDRWPTSAAAGKESAGADALFAFSVLTHLPERTFRGWLERFWQALSPGGILVVSVLDESVLWPGRTMPESGFYFEPVSESEVLDGEDYGSTWLTEERMRASIDLLSDVVRAERLPLGLWRLQDLWVIVKGGGAGPELDLPALDFDPGPVGYLELAELSNDMRRLELRGWASGFGSSPVRIELELDGKVVASVLANGQRQDLAGVEPGGTAGGYCLVHRAQEGLDPRTPFALVARSGDPTKREKGWYVIHQSTLEGADLYLRLADARRQLDALRAREAVFEASGFGRARRRWMRLKQHWR